MNITKSPTSNDSKGDFSLGFDKPRELNDEEKKKKAAVHAELDRMNLLPSNSSYAIHRMKVLNKLLHLLSIKEMLSNASSHGVRTISQDEELELLFAGLSI